MYDDEEEELLSPSIVSTTEQSRPEEDEITTKEEVKKKKNSGRNCLWPEEVVDDLVDIILESDKFKEKLLLTNVKNTKKQRVLSKLKEKIVRKLGPFYLTLRMNSNIRGWPLQPCILFFKMATKLI